MSTLRYKEIIFGPVKSKNLGSSIGIDLLPNESQSCNSKCIYCESSIKYLENKGQLPEQDEIIRHLKSYLEKIDTTTIPIDTIAFNGDIEPTLHPDFVNIVNETIILRNIYTPETDIAVFTNGTLLNKNSITKALRNVDKCFIKLDCDNKELHPVMNQTDNTEVNYITKNTNEFSRDLIVQSQFVRTILNGKMVDNTKPDFIQKWLEDVGKLNPEQVMLYSTYKDTSVPIQNVSLWKRIDIVIQADENGIDSSVI